MKKIENDELKELQLDMLKNVAEFCKERGIQYSLAFGTLLGAVRHKGFIPWDDDIDICMPRPSYDRFVQEYEDSEGIYECLTFEKDNKFLFPFAKVSDRRTVALEQARFVDKYSKLGVNIDIFPVDGARTDDLFQLRKQRQLHMIRYYKLRYLSMVNSSVKKVALLMVRAIISPLSMPTVVLAMMKNAQLHDYDESEYAEVIMGYKHEKPLLKEIYEDTILLDFEDSQFSVPAHHDTLLTHIYGDYMKYPPVEQRKPSHQAIRYYKDLK